MGTGAINPDQKIQILGPSDITYELVNGFNPTFITTLDVRYKAVTLAGGRAFIGNIEVMEDGSRKLYNDMMMYSPVGKLDIFPYSNISGAGNIMTISTGDGDEIIALESINNKLLQFKRSLMYIIDISSGLPETFFIESYKI